MDKCLLCTDAKPYENVFNVFRQGTIDDIRTSLGKLGAGHERKMRTCLALLALQERNSVILRSLLEDGIDIEEPFEDEVRRVQKKAHPQTYMLLQKYAEERKRPWAKRKRPRNRHPLDWGK